MNEPIKNEAMTLSPLAIKVNERLRVLCINKQMLAVQYHCSRSMISQYLSGKYRSNPETVEEILNRFLDETEEEYQKTLENDPKAKKVLEKMRAQDGSDEEEPEEAPEKHFPKKKRVLVSSDYCGVLSVCQSCQDDMGLGIIIGRSGYGKTYALKEYAKTPRVAYMECDDTMSTKDMVTALEMGLGLPRSTSGSIWSRVNRIRDFLNANEGYLIIVDEADKLIEDYAVLCKSRKQQVGMLSGGNIQKVVVAREFSGNPVLILADQPTRGIDVGATEFIRKKLVELSRSGIAVLLISADLAEVMELSDSLIVMHGGKIAAYFEDTSTLTDDVMGEYMLGLKTQSEEEIRRVCHD